MGICVVLNKSTRHIITSKLAVAHSSLSHVCIETDLKGYHLPKFQICANLRLWLKRGGPTKLAAPTDKVIYRAKHSSSKVQLKTLSITLSSKKKSTKWLKARLNVFSQSHIHNDLIMASAYLNNLWAIFSTVFPGNLFATKAKSIESDWCPLARGLARERGGQPMSPATMYISTRLFVCKKKCPSLPGFCTSDTSCQPPWNGNCDPLELKTLAIYC